MRRLSNTSIQDELDSDDDEHRGPRMIITQTNESLIEGLEVEQPIFKRDEDVIKEMEKNKPAEPAVEVVDVPENIYAGTEFLKHTDLPSISPS